MPKSTEKPTLPHTNQPAAFQRYADEHEKKGSKELEVIRFRWKINSVKDRIQATFEKEKALASIKIERNMRWPSVWNAPYFLIPENEVDSDIINTILIKSWETQGSACPSLPRCFIDDDILSERGNFKITAFLFYYLKNIPGIRKDIKRIVGIQEYRKGMGDGAASWLKIGQHSIENTFHLQTWNQFRGDAKQYMMWRNCLKLLEADPSTATWFPGIRGVEWMRKNGNVYPKVDGMDDDKVGLVCGRDEKMEQKLAFEKSCNFNERRIIYDIKMREFIKEKYGVEIESLANKWSRMCWNCCLPKEGLLRCSKCDIAKYCGKDCQREDWKVHKELHGLEKYLKPIEEGGLPLS